MVSAEEILTRQPESEKKQNRDDQKINADIRIQLKKVRQKVRSQKNAKTEARKKLTTKKTIIFSIIRKNRCNFEKIITLQIT